jgi:NAD(P)-dependent dehydrogenase (short-subunit alcohol dehydrogenase family)
MANKAAGTRTAVVTGGAGDIGSEIARHLSADGWQVILQDIRDDLDQEQR